MYTKIYSFLILFIFSSHIFAAERFEFEQIHMAVAVRVLLYADSEEIADRCAKAAFEKFVKINAIMSDYDRESEIVQLALKNDKRFQNSTDDGWYKISDELYEVFKAARHYSEISDGAFEVSISPLVQLWRRAKRQQNWPKGEDVETARNLTGLKFWELDDTDKRVRLLKKGVRFDLGAIAKGYAVDQAFDAIRQKGVKICLVDAGGDMRLGDAPLDGWKIGIVKTDEQQEPILNLTLDNVSIATSGDTFQYFEVDGKRYSHIIDPKTGLPLTTRCIVTVKAKTAMEADALASAVSVLGPEKGIELINTLPDAETFIVQEGKELNFYRSTNWD